MNIRPLYILLLLGFFSRAQSPFTKVKESLEAEDYKTSQRILDSCSSKKFCEDSVIFYSGLVNLKKGKLKEAKQNYKQLLSSYPSFYEMHYLNGAVFFLLNDYARSIDEFNLVLEKNPRHYKALYNRGLASGLLEDYPSAIEDLGICISINPKSSAAHYSRAYWYEFTGNFTEAKSDYEKTISLDPKNYDAYFGLAYIHKLQGQTQNACDIINQAIRAGSQIAEELKENFCR
jgi:tetratricopeptide (TPR) repeat protein